MRSGELRSPEISPAGLAPGRDIPLPSGRVIPDRGPVRREVVMRRAMIAAALVLLPVSLPAPQAYAQSRPAPGTPGTTPESADEGLRMPSRSFTDALRVLVVTSGIIGGFVAADIMSGGALTTPLLSSGAALAGTNGARLLARAAPLRPVIAPSAAPAEAAGLTSLSNHLGRALTRGKPAS